MQTTETKISHLRTANRQTYTSRSLKQRRLRNIKEQQGWTIWSMLFVMGVIMFFSYIGMQLVPVYAANENVKNAIKRSLDEAELNKISRAYIIRKLHAQLYLDGSHKLLNYKTDLKVRRSKKEVFVEVRYRREVPLFYNLSLMASFENIEQRKLNEVL